MLNRLHRNFILISCLLPVACLSQSGSFWKKSSFGSRFYYGSFLITKAKAEYIRDSYGSYGEIYFEHQTVGKKDWEITHKYPSWGVSLLYGNTGSRQYIGKLTALYGWLNLPLINSKNYSASFLLGGGPGMISKPYDIYTNPKNTLIGTRLNAYINLLVKNNFVITKHIGAEAGIGFMHLSNGGTTLPNLGLNTPCIFAGIKYSLQDKIEFKTSLKDSFTKKFEFKAFTSVGFKQAPWVGGNHYTINVVQTEATYRAKRNYSYGAGLMFAYNRSLDYFPLENPSYEKRGQKKLQVGAYAAYEHFFGRLSVPLNMGTYVHNRAKSPVLFQQFGLRYAVSKHISTELMLKLHMGQADFIHTGIGYNF